MVANKTKIVINSDTKSLEKVENFINEILDDFKIEQKQRNKILLCVSEAVVNAIEHGNKNDTNKKVIIKCALKKRHIKFFISDQGEGFDVNNVNDPTSGENIKKEKGRGIHIIRTLSERIRFHKKGNTIEFKFKLSGENIFSQ